MLGADAFFRMGSTHSVCQDYALAGLSGGRPFALLADGCSGTSNKNDPGSPHTDFGARFIVRSAMRNLGAMFEGSFRAAQIITDADGMRRQASLDRGALDATLLAAVQCGRTARVYQTGDGVIAARKRDGGVVAYVTSFDEGAPFYLNYLLDAGNEAAYRQVVKTVTVSRLVFAPGVGWAEPVDVDHAISDFGICQQYSFDASEFDVVAVLSDGAQSFTDKSNEVIPVEAILEQVMAIKGLAGEFLARRCSAFLRKHCAEQAWAHADDFSIAGIYLGAMGEG